MEGQARPPQLIGANYGIQKARAQGVNVQELVTLGWTHPTRTQDDKIEILVPVDQWNAAAITNNDNNNKALNIIIGTLDEGQFGLIAGCNSAKDALEILEKLYEGDSSVKQTKMQQFHTRFEELRMKDEETIVEFNARVQRIEK